MAEQGLDTMTEAQLAGGHFSQERLDHFIRHLKRPLPTGLSSETALLAVEKINTWAEDWSEDLFGEKLAVDLYKLFCKSK